MIDLSLVFFLFSISFLLAKMSGPLFIFASIRQLLVFIAGKMAGEKGRESAKKGTACPLCVSVWVAFVLYIPYPLDNFIAIMANLGASWLLLSLFMAVNEYTAHMRILNSSV